MNKQKNGLRIINDIKLELSPEDKLKLEKMHDWSFNQQKSEKNIELMASVLNLTNDKIVQLKEILNMSTQIKLRNSSRKSSIKQSVQKK